MLQQDTRSFPAPVATCSSARAGQAADKRRADYSNRGDQRQDHRLAQGVGAAVVVVGVGTCESAVDSPGTSGRKPWIAPITAAGPSPATPATACPRSWAWLLAWSVA